MFYLSLKQDDNFLWKLRETFFLQNIIEKVHIDNIFYKSRTDFVVSFEWKFYEFEVWWKNKSRNDVFVVKDDILLADENTIPLWLFSFLE